MLTIEFSRERAEYLLAALRDGHAFLPLSPDSGWPVGDALALAGACVFQAAAHGPPAYHAKGASPKTIPKEHQEAIEGTYWRDLHAAVRAYALLYLSILKTALF